MGNEISVPLGSYVFANCQTSQIYGQIVTGDKLNASYASGAYPYGFTFTPSHKFECHGYCPVRSSTLWQRVA